MNSNEQANRALPPEIKNRVHGLCQRYSKGLADGASYFASDFLHEVQKEWRDSLLEELLMVQFEFLAN